MHRNLAAAIIVVVAAVALAVFIHPLFAILVLLALLFL